MKCAIVGAGVAGLICARVLREQRHEVIVYDKGGRVGGRLASRDRDADQFDYGAQYFTARDPRFAKEVEEWVATGIAAEWQGNFARLKQGKVENETVSSPRFVGLPLMRSIGEKLVRKTEVRTSHKIDEVGHLNEKWFVAGSKRFAGSWDRFAAFDYDVIVLNMPPAQVIDLVPCGEAESVQLEPCWTVMLSFADRLEIPFDGAYIHGGPLSWVARDSSKVGRPEGERWVLQASAEWSAQNIDLSEEQALSALREEFSKQSSASLPKLTFEKAHLWRYAKPVNPLSAGFIYDAERSIGYCGDWCQGARVEDAFVSGLKLAECILASRG